MCLINAEPAISLQPHRTAHRSIKHLITETQGCRLPNLQLEAATRMNDALGEIGCQSGCQDTEQPDPASQDPQNVSVKVVSRLGIEPRTRRLRVCCSAN